MLKIANDTAQPLRASLARQVFSVPSFLVVISGVASLQLSRVIQIRSGVLYVVRPPARTDFFLVGRSERRDWRGFELPLIIAL